MSENNNSKFVENIQCHKCGSSSGLAVYQDNKGEFNGYCFACGTTYREHPYGDRSDTEIESCTRTEYRTQRQENSQSSGENTSIEEIERNSSIRSLPERGLDQEVCEKYGVRSAVDPINGETTHHYSPFYQDGKLIAYQEREVATKKFTMIGLGKNLPLFGKNICGTGGKMLVITEGPTDCMAAYQMFMERGKNYRVCALPNGANPRSVFNDLDWVESFDNVFIALDQDKPGNKAAKEIAEALSPGKAHIMSFEEKDPNDMLVAGKGAQFFNSLYNAQPYRPDGIVGVDDVFEEAIKPVKWGLSWPWPTLTAATYGYRRGELYGFGAGSGGGKTESFKEIADHVIYTHKLPLGVIFLEEPVSKTLKVLAGKHVNKRFHVPDGNWTIDELTTGISELRGKVYLYNHFGGKDWESIKAKIRYMVVALGIKDILLDHLTALVAQEENEYKALNRIMEEMASLTQELDFTLFYISHLRKPVGTPHEEGGRVHADQFKGSGAIVYWSNFLFGCERNQQSEDEIERNTTTFRILKDRNTGLSTGTTFKLWYDHNTGRMLEMKDEDGLHEL